MPPRGRSGRGPASRSYSPLTSTKYDPADPANLRRCLGRNDVELAALSRLHAALNLLRSAIVDEFGEGALVEMALDQRAENADKAAAAGNKAAKAEDGESSGDDGENGPSNGDASAASPASRLERLTRAFAVRMKLRRRLLNRLARRLHRIAHVMDGNGASVAAPNPPSHGDLVVRVAPPGGERPAPGQVRSVTGDELRELSRRVEERKAVVKELEITRARRRGEKLDGGTTDGAEKDTDEDADEDAGEEDSKDEVPEKSDLDRLLDGDEEDAPLLAKIADVEPGYDRVAVPAALPPLPSPGKSPKPKAGSRAEPSAAPHRPVTSTPDDHEVLETGEYALSKSYAGQRVAFAYFGTNPRPPQPAERANEWKRWTKEMGERIPAGQPTFDELERGGDGVVFGNAEERLKKRKKDEADEKADGGGRGGKVLRKSGGKELRKKTEAADDEAEEGAEKADAKADDETKEADEEAKPAAEETPSKNKKKQGAKEPRKKPKVHLSTAPVPSFYHQDRRRMELLQIELVGYHNGGAIRDEFRMADREYQRSYQESIRLQGERQRAQTELTDAKRRYERECAKIRALNEQTTRNAHGMWRKRQLLMARAREIFGEEGATRREAVNGVLQDCLDRCAVRDEEDSNSGSRALASASAAARRTGDATRASVAAALGHMVDAVDRRDKDAATSGPTFREPVLPTPGNVVADPATGRTLSDIWVPILSRARRAFDGADARFREAEQTRTKRWTVRTELQKRLSELSGGGRATAARQARPQTQQYRQPSSAAATQSAYAQSRTQTSAAYVGQQYPSQQARQQQAAAQQAVARIAAAAAAGYTARGSGGGTALDSAVATAAAGVPQQQTTLAGRSAPATDALAVAAAVAAARGVVVPPPRPPVAPMDPSEVPGVVASTPHGALARVERREDGSVKYDYGNRYSKNAIE